MNRADGSESASGHDCALPRIAAVILAAGHSRRMAGKDKLLLETAGQPMIRRAALAALRSHCCATHIVLQPRQSQRSRHVSDLPASITFSGRACAGIAMSLRSGIAAAAASIDGAVIMLADMPEIEAGDLNALIAAFRPGAIAAASAAGFIGNPVLFPKDLFPELSQLTGDTGARSMLWRHREALTLVELPGDRARIDLDTPEDWRMWLSRQPGAEN